MNIVKPFQQHIYIKTTVVITEFYLIFHFQPLCLVQFNKVWLKKVKTIFPIQLFKVY